MDECWDDNPDPWVEPANPAPQSTQYNTNNWYQERPQQNFRRGRQGSKIASLQEESGARIHIDKNSFGEETEIKISGDSAAIQKAKELIMDLTVERKANYEQNNKPPEEPKQEMDLDTFLKQCEDAEQAEWAKYPPTVKNFYEEHPQISKMSQKEVDEFRLSNNNTMIILELIKEAGFTEPSPIQSQAWPVLLSGEDLIGIAQTGTGKTLAFLLPALIHIEGQITPRQERSGPSVLVMAPTRELALQIHNEVQKYKYRGITSLQMESQRVLRSSASADRATDGDPQPPVDQPQRH
ncbi:unnamed protein product [Diabrotica balteata]|uniref:Helicase ATP-binding domain-containing protein n=1 Tax=Diabrotica balteata TaxID=107213 RepID=A0A9P0GWL0_DIABA|nr:unnamed protein product [Diabrotica balteata]